MPEVRFVCVTLSPITKAGAPFMGLHCVNNALANPFYTFVVGCLLVCVCVCHAYAFGMRLCSVCVCVRVNFPIGSDSKCTGNTNTLKEALAERFLAGVLCPRRHLR